MSQPHSPASSYQASSLVDSSLHHWHSPSDSHSTAPTSMSDAPVPMPGGFLAALNAGSDNFNHQHAQQQSQNSFGISTQQQENQPVRQLGLTWSNMKQGLDSYVNALLHDKKSHDVVVQAWKERCETLQNEVRRLSLHADNNNTSAGSPVSEMSMLDMANGKLAGSKASLTKKPYVLVLLEAEGALFKKEYWVDGAAGGREAAALLAEQIESYTSTWESQIEYDHLVVMLFCHKRKLTKTLIDAGYVADAKVVEAFATAFVAGPDMLLVDSGTDPLATVAKMTQIARLHSHDDNCTSIFVSEVEGAGYPGLAPAHDKAHIDVCETKLRLISPSDVPAETRCKSIVFPALFVATEDKPVPRAPVEQWITAAAPTPKSAPLTSSPTAAKTTSTPPSAHHHNGKRGGSHSYHGGAGGNAQLDPSKPMSKQNPPPCNAYYISHSGCYNPECKFSHEYHLSESQMNEMRRGAAHHPCYNIKNMGFCPDGELCVYGHVCPRGASCTRKDCRFPDDQHPVSGARNKRK